MLLTKLVIIFQEIFSKFSENWKVNREHWENDSELISCKIIFRKIVGKFSVNIRNSFVSDIKYTTC